MLLRDCIASIKTVGEMDGEQRWAVLKRKGMLELTRDFLKVSAEIVSNLGMA